MAVTDLSGMSDLPWWVRQGGPNVSPAQAGAQSGGNNLQWLNYLQQMFPGMSQSGNPANMPSPDASNMSVVMPPNPGGFNVPPGPGMPPVSPPAPLPPPAPPVVRGALAAGAPGYAGSTGVSLDPRLQDAAMNRMTGMAGGVTNQAYQPPNITPGRTNPNAPAANVQPTSAATPPVNPAATGGAGGVGAMSNPRFTTIDRPNAPAGGSPYGAGGAPLATALNLAGLFGGGGPGATGGPAAAPQGVRGPLASGSGGISMADLYPAAAARGQTPGPFNISSADLYPARAVTQGGGPMPSSAINALAQHYPGRLNMSPGQLATYMQTQPWLQNLRGA